jgi:peptidoglycan hydrolase-like protein with peptidoglycan-binding domain
MNLVGRNLSIDMHGDDIMQLHSELRRVGYSLPEDELRRAYFGLGTREAVLAFQRAHSVPETGIVDARTAAALGEAVATQTPRPMSQVASELTQASTARTPGDLGEPEPAVPTQPLPASAHPSVPSGPIYPAPSGGASDTSAAAPGVPTPADSPPASGGAGVPPAAGGPPAPPSGVGDAGWLGVEGHVRLSDDTPLPGVAVQAFKATVGRAPVAIGDRQAITGLEGAYTIHYPASTFARTRTAALLVRVLDAHGKILATSPRLCPPDERTTVDLIVAKDAAGIPSEYERLLQQLEQQVSDVEVPGAAAPTIVDKLAVLTPEDLDLLADCTTLDRARLGQLVSAAQLQQRARAANANVPAPVFYGLARVGQSLDPVGLCNRGSPALRQALERALNDNLIPANLAGMLEAIMAELQRFVVLATLRTPPADGLRPIGDLLSLVLTPDQQITYLALQNMHQGSPQQFWDSLRHQTGFQAPGLVDTLQVNDQLNQLTQGHVPLVAALRQSYRFTSPRELVRLTQAQWVELINTHVNGSPVGLPPGVPGKTPLEQTNAYVDGIMRTLQKQYPTDTAAVVVQAPNLNIQPTIRQGILQFFANSPDFDLARTHVDHYLAANTDTALNGIAQGDQASVAAQVKRLQRVYRLSDSPEQMTALLGTQFDSARAIATTPRAVFVRHMQGRLGGEVAARQVYDKAESVQVFLLHVATTLYDEEFGVRPRILNRMGPPLLGGGNGGVNAQQAPAPGKPTGGNEGVSSVGPRAEVPPAVAGGSSDGPTYGPDSSDGPTYGPDSSDGPASGPGVAGGPGSGGGAPAQGPGPGIPSLTTLFGSLDTCACDECRSVLGPSAYLVDLLELLRKTPAQQGTSSLTMQDVLFARRPDIPLINLTCENADTELPYIDLVNEILETYVAVYSNWYATHASAIDVSQYRDQLGSEATYVANATPTNTNTSTNDTGDATPDELLASPQYLIEGAYDELKGAIYPLTLPFDLPLETARVYLQSQGSSLYQVMQTFQPDGQTVSAPHTTVLQRLNSEYLKFAPEEYTLLTGQQQFNEPGNPTSKRAATSADYYGYTLHPGATAVHSGNQNNLPTVCEFLNRTGLKLDELLKLLRMRTVNPSYPVIPILEQLDLDYTIVYKLSVLHFPTSSTDPQITGWISDVMDAVNAKANAQDSRFADLSYQNLRQWFTNAQVGLANVIIIETGVKSGTALTYLASLGIQYADVQWLLNSFPKGGFPDPSKPSNVSVQAQGYLDRIRHALQAVGADPAQFAAWVNAHWDALKSASNSCDTCDMALKHVDGSDLNEGEWRWLYFFIRLWRKLGWTMEDLDNALANWLLPWPWMATLSSGPVSRRLMPSVIDRLSQVAQLHDTLKVPVADLLPLWVDFTGDGTTLANEGLPLISPRYQQLFLNRAMRKNDPVFQPTWRGVAPNPQDLPITMPPPLALPSPLPPPALPAPTTLDSHAVAIASAFRISQTDLADIRAQTGLAVSSTLLTMQTLSTIYRRVMLSRALKLRIPDLFSLIALSGLDPFAHPGTTIQFAQFAHTVQSSSLSIAQLAYLCQNLDTSPSSLAPKSDDMVQLAAQLRSGLSDIASQTQEVPDPTGAVLQVPDPTGAVLQTMLGKLFDAPTVAQTMHMLDGTQVYSTTLPATGYLDMATYQQLSSDLQSRVTFVPPLSASLSQLIVTGTLRIRGPLTSHDYSTLVSLAPTNTDFTYAVDAIFNQPSTFIGNAFVGFLTTTQDQLAAIQYLLERPPSVTTPPTPPPTTAEKYQYVLHRYLPFLQDRLKRLFVKQAVATALGLDQTVVAVLLENVGVLHSRTTGAFPAVVDALALSTQGLTADYETLSLPTTTQQNLPTIDASSPPPNTVSAVYSSSVTTSQSAAGAYAFSVTTSPGALLQLELREPGGLALVAGFSALAPLAPLSSGAVMVSFPPAMLAANHTYDLKLTIYFPESAPYGFVTAAKLQWRLPDGSQATPTGIFTAQYTTDAASTSRSPVTIQPAQQIAAFGSGVVWDASMAGVPGPALPPLPVPGVPSPALPPLPTGADTNPNTAIAVYTGTISGPTLTPNPIGFHLFADSGALMAWTIMDQQTPPNQVGGSNGWQSLQSGRADWTCALTPGQTYTLTVQVMANAAFGSPTCAALTGVQVTWDTTAPMQIVPSSSLNAVTVTYGVVSPSWPAGDVQTSTTLVPAVVETNVLPQHTIRAEYHGLLLVTTADTYTFSVLTDANAQVQLTIGANTYGNVTTTLVSGPPPAGKWLFPCALAAGHAYELDLVILAPGMASSPSPTPLRFAPTLTWSSATQLETAVPAAQLIPDSIVRTFEHLYTVLRKIALLVTPLHLTADEITYFSANKIQFEGFDLDLIAPTSATTQATQLMAMWQRVNAYATLRSSLPQSQSSVLDIFTLASSSAPTQDALDALKQLIVAVTGWDKPTLDSLIDGLDLTTTSFVSDVALTRVQQCLQQAGALGVTPAKLITWASDALQSTFGDEDAQDIKRTIKAKYDDTAWIGVVRPLADTLRERQRDALVAYILGLGQGGFSGLTVGGVPVTDTNLLYEYLLIDTEMSACMLTSRIVQATAAVQLFVQRCQLGLEAPLVDPTATRYKDDTEDFDTWWSWMKLYRVWQANRKVFLWPENYIVESLRDDKTPFYKEDFEPELLKGQLTKDRIESAVTHYLAMLDQVANLEMCGLYWEQSSDPAADPETPVDVLHVFGRTRNTPRIYFYRQLQNQTTWTPWERVQLDIEGDHLIPVVWNRRLYLFWPRFTMKSLQDPKKQRTYYEITLAWSEYKQGKWQPKEVSKETAYYDYQLHTSPPQAANPGDGYTGASDILLGVPPATFSFRAALWDDRSLHIMMYASTADGKALTESTPYAVYTVLNPTAEFNFDGQSGHIEVTAPMLEGQVYTYALPSPIYVPPGTNVSPKGMTFVGDSTLAIWGPSHQRDDLLYTPPGSYVVLPPANQYAYPTGQLFFYQDATRTYLCVPEFPSSGFPQVGFYHHYHPYVSQFVGDLSRKGIAGLLTLDNQMWSERAFDWLHGIKNLFFWTYGPFEGSQGAWYHITSHPFEQVDFAGNKPDCPFADYNWELFFHIPFRIAPLLSQNLNFDAAETMFRYIFDITKSPNYWQVLPFTGVDPQAEQIQNLLLDLHTGNQTSVQDQIDAMRQHPFEPHMIARLRLSAYMKAVVIQYIQHHLAWADHLYRLADQASDREFLNEALQHYILVAQLLGPRPQTVPNPGKTKPQNYKQLRADKLDAFSNAWVAMENEFPFLPTASSGQGGSGWMATVAHVFYFCIPANDQLLEFWNKVDHRISNIRHCMTIDDVVRQPPLFAPEINPMLLVQAAAQGIDLGSVLNDVFAPLPYYRFTYMLQKALDLCSDVRSLGAALLAALEKQDAEALALMRAANETALLTAMHDVKKQQVDEATAALAALRQTRAVTAERFSHYSTLLGAQRAIVPAEGQPISVGSPPGLQLNALEQTHLDELQKAYDSQHNASLLGIQAQQAHLIPSLTTGSSGVASPVVTAEFGGPALGAALEAIAMHFSADAALHSFVGTNDSILGGYLRRDEEWRHQLNLAAAELTQIDAQIAAAKIRSQIAATELQNHELQTSNAQQVQDFVTNKFTNQDLYGWMQGQISTLYYQAYSMAYDLAKQAERAYRFERGLTDSNYIQFGYWDSAHNGLMAGEQLHLALKQLERAYQDQNKRDYEITKQISLALVNPLALIALKETGSCEVELPEALFDADYPGHYMRRIKTMAITIPCVVGPYTSINCTLTLLSNITRITSDPAGSAGGYGEGDSDDRFVHNFASIQSIATSHAQNDTGMFELNFRDERYLPFEGAGTVSRWRIELPKDNNAFDFNTITDVILRLQYTARDGGATLAKPAHDSLTPDPTAISGYRLFSAKHEFAAAWIQFLSPTDPNFATLQLDLSPDRFGYQLRGKTVTIQTVDLYLFLDDLLDPEVNVKEVQFVLTSGTNQVYSTVPSTSALQPLTLKRDTDNTVNPPRHRPVMSASVTITESVDNRGQWSLWLLRQLDPNPTTTTPTTTTPVFTFPSTQQPIPQALAPQGSTQPPYSLDPTKVRDLLIVCEYSIAQTS